MKSGSFKYKRLCRSRNVTRNAYGEDLSSRSRIHADIRWACKSVSISAATSYNGLVWQLEMGNSMVDTSRGVNERILEGYWALK